MFKDNVFTEVINKIALIPRGGMLDSPRKMSNFQK